MFMIPKAPPPRAAAPAVPGATPVQLRPFFFALAGGGGGGTTSTGGGGGGEAERSGGGGGDAAMTMGTVWAPFCRAKSSSTDLSAARFTSRDEVWKSLADTWIWCFPSGSSAL